VDGRGAEGGVVIDEQRDDEQRDDEEGGLRLLRLPLAPPLGRTGGRTGTGTGTGTAEHAGVWGDQTGLNGG